MQLVKIARAIGILNRTFQAYITKALTETDLSYSESIFLVNIGDRPGISQEELSTLLAIDKAAVARSVKSLGKKDYIRTERSKQDKRAKELYLTDSGEEFIQFMDNLHRQWAEQIMSDMNEDDLEIFALWMDSMSNRAKTFEE